MTTLQTKIKELRANNTKLKKARENKFVEEWAKFSEFTLWVKNNSNNKVKVNFEKGKVEFDCKVRDYTHTYTVWNHEYYFYFDNEESYISIENNVELISHLLYLLPEVMPKDNKFKFKYTEIDELTAFCAELSQELKDSDEKFDFKIEEINGLTCISFQRFCNTCNRNKKLFTIKKNENGTFDQLKTDSYNKNMPLEQIKEIILGNLFNKDYS